MPIAGAKNPRVTVLMPFYNSAPFLREATASILAQSFGDFELLAVDDGSTDDGLAILESFADPRIRVLHNKENQGLVASLNRGIAAARGEYLARMDSDDISHPERLARQVAYLDTHPEVGVCSTWAVFIDAHGRETGMLRTPTGVHLQCLFWKPSPLVHAAMLARTALLKQNLYDPAFTDAEDYELLLRLHSLTSACNLPEALYKIRRHGGNVSIAKRNSQLHNSYRAFCLFVGHEQITYESFLALSFVSFSMNPFLRFLAARKASKRTRVSFPVLVRDCWNYYRKIY